MSQPRTTTGAGVGEASQAAAAGVASPPASPEAHPHLTMEPARGSPSSAAGFHPAPSASSSPWSLRPGFVGASVFASSAASSSPLGSPTSTSRRGGRVAYVPIVASPAHTPAGNGPTMATAAIVPASATMAGGAPKEVPMAWASSSRDQPLRVAARQPATSTPTNQAASATAALGASASLASASPVDFTFSSASSTPLPSPVTATAGTSSSLLSRTLAHDPIGSPSLLHFRLDPNSPQMQSSRPLPRVIHRASNIAAGATAAGASPTAAAAGGVVVAKADAKKDTHSPVMAVRARPVPNLSAAISSTKPLVGFFEAKGQSNSPPVSSRAAPTTTLTIPTSGLTPTSASTSPSNIMIDHSPPAWHRAHSHAGGEDPYAPTSAPAFPTMVVGTPTRPPTAGSPQSQLHGKQSAQRNLLGLHYDEPAVDLKPDGASLLNALQAARNNASPSPSSSQKRAHQSWSVPARGSVSGGQAGFSSSSFRPMLQKELYLSGAAATSPTHQHNNSQPSLSPIQPQPSPRHRSSLSQSGSSSASGYSAGTSSRPSPTHGGGGTVGKDGGKLSNVTEGLEMGEVRLHIDGIDHYPTPSPRSSISSGEGRVRSPSAVGTASGKALNLPRSPVQGRGSGSGGALPRKPLEDTPSHRFGRSEKATPGSATDERTAMVRVASPSWHERFRHRLNHFPTQIPYSKAIALSLLHPTYTIVAFLLTLVAVFALDFQLAFFVDTSTRACDVLLLIIGCTWVIEFVALSLVLPGYLLHHFQWYMDLVAILSLAVDISALDGLGMDARVAYRSEANSNWTESTTFHGLADSGNSKVWLFLHLARLVRLFKYWNGIEAFAGKIDLKAIYMRIAARGHPGAAASSSSSSHAHGSGPFFKSSTLGLHLTSTLQKTQTLVLLVVIMLFTLLAPNPVQVNNNGACVNGALAVNGASATTASSFAAYSSMEQWTVAHMNALYTQAVKESELTLTAATTAGDPAAPTMATLIESHASYRSAHTMATSMRASFGEKLLVLSLSAPDTSYPKPTMFFPANLAAGTRSFEVTTYQCGGALLLMSNAARVHEVAVWNILLLLFLFLLFICAQSYTAYILATTISAPLERMSKVVRKMAGTVMFLQPTDGDADRDPWEARRGSKSTASGGGGNASSSPKRGIVGPGGRALSASSSSWYLTNRTSSTSILSFGSSCGSGGSLSGWVPPAVPPHREFDLLEEVVTKMASVFNLLPGGLASLITDSSSGGEGQEKARRMMVGSRRTELKTRDSILTIDVVERPITANAPSVHKDGGGHHHHGSSSGAGAHHDRPGSSRAFGFGAKGGASERLSEADAQQKQHNDEFFSSSTLLNLPASPLHGGGSGGSGIHPQLALSTMHNPAGRASIHHALAHDSELRFESHPELKSLEDLLQDPFASIHFKSYLHKKFCLETISFYEQVAKYKARMQSWAFRIYHQFVVAGAPNEINIHSAQRQAISNEIFHPTLETFNAAQKEVYKLMKNNFLEFLVSQACYQYLTAKQHQQLSIKVSEDQM